MAGSKQTRAWFFTTSGDSKIGNFWTRFVGGGVSKPNQQTLENLTESVPFFKESTSAASVDTGQLLELKQGLTVIASDANAKAGTNTADGSTGGMLVTQPSQLPTVNEGSGSVDTINNAITNFTTVALDVTADSTTTRNNYIVTLSTNFKNWLAGIINSINTSLGNLSTAVSTLNGDVTTINSTLGTLQSEIDALSIASGSIYETTSSTDNTIGLGNLTFTVAAALSYTPGVRVRAADVIDPTNFVEGLVVSYSGTTLVINADFTGGSGTILNWNINLGGKYEKYITTSTSSVLISFDVNKTFTVEAGLAYKYGMKVRASQVGTPSTFIDGMVASYSGTTLVITPDSMGGSGYGSSIANWDIYLAGSVKLLSSNISITPTFIGGGTPTASATVRFTRGNGMITLSFGISYSGGSGSYSLITLAMPVGLRAFDSYYYGSAFLTSNNSLCLKVATNGNSVIIALPSGGTAIPSGSQSIFGFISYPFE